MHSAVSTPKGFLSLLAVFPRLPDRAPRLSGWVSKNFKWGLPDFLLEVLGFYVKISGHSL